MSREIKRVPLDFDWPIDETWKGYKPPKDGTQDCESCDHTDGLTRQGSALLAVIDSIPSRATKASETDLVFLRALAKASEEDATVSDDRYYSFLGLDRTSVHHDLVKLVGKSLGISLACPACNGEGFVIVDAAQYALAKTWEPYEPPVGPGWQVWESVSTGSPITPVYPTAEALIAALQAVGTRYDGRFSRKSAEAFVRAGWAPSAGAVEGGSLLDGVDIPLACEEAEQKS
jgi:hypothetical protein